MAQSSRRAISDGISHQLRDYWYACVRGRDIGSKQGLILEAEQAGLLIASHNVASSGCLNVGIKFVSRPGDVRIALRTREQRWARFA